MPSTGFLPKQWRHQHQRHHSLEGYVCKGGNVRLIKRFDSDWIVFAKNNDGDAFARVGSMEDRPTCQDVENVGREGVGYKYGGVMMPCKTTRSANWSLYN